jgi:hypothetical protein
VAEPTRTKRRQRCDAGGVFSAFSSDGHRAAWSAWAGPSSETVTLHWENEGWTAEGIVRGADVHYVLRLSAAWHVQQVLLFRDLDQPDLWMATDGAGRWGEVNGAHRPEIDGCTEIWFTVTSRADDETAVLSPFPAAIPIRRLAAIDAIGPHEAAQVHAVTIDVETLGVVGRRLQYEHVTDLRWRVRDVDTDDVLAEFDVDAHGLPMDVEGQFRRAD